MDLIEGIVLKSRPYLDQAKIVFVLTSNGKQSFILKGGTSLKSHSYSFQQELTKITYATQKNYFKGGKVLAFYPQIKIDMKRLPVALQLVELADTISDHVSDTTVFYQFTSDILTLLEQGIDPTLLLIIYQLKNLYLLGLAPVFHQCVDCKTKDDLVGFVITRGGMTCRHCQEAGEAFVPIHVVNDMGRLYETKLLDMNFSELTQSIDKNSLLFVLKQFYEHFLGFKSRVLSIVQQLNIN
ncbi:MAG: DNA repair protein RecO [Bacilli bacterium]